MAKDGKKTAVPKLRFPEFREGWAQIQVGDFFDLSAKAEKTETFDRDKLLTVKLHGNGVVKNERATLTGGANYFTRSAGQFIFSKIDLLNGAFGIVPDALDGFSSSSDVPAYSFKADQSPTFFLNWLSSHYERLAIERTGTSSTLKRVSPDRFLALDLFAPSPAEQQKITDCLSSLDELIATQGRKVEALKNYERGLMQQLFPRGGETHPRLRFPEFQNAGEWVCEELSCCLEKVIDYRGKAPPKSDSGVPLITARNVRFGWLDMTSDEYIGEGEYTEWMSKGIPQDGDVLFTTEAPLGNVALFPSTGKFALGQRILTLRPRSEKCLSAFLFQSLLGPSMQKEIDFHSTGTTAKGIKSAVFVKISFCYPGVDEQRRIADYLTPLDEVITGEANELVALKTHKKGLMQQLFPSLEEK